MLILKQILLWVLLCLEYSGANVCLILNRQLFYVSCDTSNSTVHTHVEFVKEANRLLPFQCDLFVCNTVNVSSTQLSANLNLGTSLVNIPFFNVTKYYNSLCETPNRSFNICNEITIHSNPESVNCTTRLDNSYIIYIKCLIYPSGRLKDIIIKTNNISSTNESISSSHCYNLAIKEGDMYYTTECDIYLYYFKLGAGNHQITVVISPDVNDSNFTITKDVFIPLYDELQEPTCSEPYFYRGGFGSFSMTCSAPIFNGDCKCQLISRTNNTVIKQMDSTYAEHSIYLDQLVVRCSFEIRDILGAGKYEFQIIMTGKNDAGKMYTKRSNWTSPVNLYHPTHMNYTVNGSPEGVTINAGDNVTFHCSVDGFPPAIGIISHDEMPYMPSIYMANPNVSMTINSCQQAGIYTCSSSYDSTYYGNIEKKVYVNTPCPFRLPYDRNAERNTINLGTWFRSSDADIKVFGYPRPISMTISSSQESDKSLVSGSFNVTYTEDFGPYGNIEIAFKITDLIKKLANFTLNVDNGVGTTYFDFTIKESTHSVNSVIKHF